MGFPIRQAGRHHLAIQKKSSRMAKKQWILEDLTTLAVNELYTSLTKHLPFIHIYVHTNLKK